jgi:glycosyltransferase involved in cell wall biosynthesis
VTAGGQPLHVLHVVMDLDRGGIQTLVVNLFRAIDKRRVTFDFLVHRPDVGVHEAEIQAAGGRVYRAPTFAGWNYLSYRRAVARLLREHPEWRVVHGHVLRPAPIYLSLARRAGRATVMHAHNQNGPLTLRAAGRRVVLAAIRARPVDWWLAASQEAGLARFGRRRVAGANYSILRNGVDTNEFICTEAGRGAARASLGVVGEPVIGFVGRLVRQKNPMFLVEVFRRVVASLPEAVLVIVGDGPMDAELKRAFHNSGAGDHVRFLGPRDDVPDLLKAMDVLLMPSLHEGLPLVAVEAQAAGLPCVLSTGVPPAVVLTPDCRRLSLAAGQDAWAQATLLALGRADAATRLGQLDMVRSAGFDVAASASWLTSLYESLP